MYQFDRKFSKVSFPSSKVVEPTPFAADDWAGLWNTHQDTETGQYRVPFKFLDYPEENKVKVREHVQEFNRASCIKIVEVSEDDPVRAFNETNSGYQNFEFDHQFLISHKQTTVIGVR